MAKKVNSVHDMTIDEVSLVDVPANPYAAVMIQKNFQEADMPAGDLDTSELFNRAGEPLPEDYDFTPGEVVYNASGQMFEFDPEAVEDGAQAQAEVGELAEVGKSAFFAGSAARTSVAKGLAQELKETLAKAATGDSATREVLSKALEAVQAADQRAEQAMTIAKSERDIRLTGQFIEVAKAYNVPADPTELGGVLMRMAQTMDDGDCAVIHKALTAAGTLIYEEIGITGNATADGSDPMQAAEEYAAGQVAKAAGGATTISKASKVVEFYNENPDAYEDYLASRRG